MKHLWDRYCFKKEVNLVKKNLKLLLLRIKPLLFIIIKKIIDPRTNCL